MLHTALIGRRHAESARRRAMELAATLDPNRDVGSDPDGSEVEMIGCVRLWNAFCRQEQARIDAASAARRGTPAAAVLAAGTAR